jgi:hypothetical protein
MAAKYRTWYSIMFSWRVVKLDSGQMGVGVSLHRLQPWRGDRSCVPLWSWGKCRIRQDTLKAVPLKLNRLSCCTDVFNRHIMNEQLTLYSLILIFMCSFSVNCEKLKSHLIRAEGAFCCNQLFENTLIYLVFNSEAHKDAVILNWCSECFKLFYL